MSAKYCMKCGAKNELDAIFCKKCATSFNATIAKPKRLPVLPVEEEDAEDNEEQLRRLHKRKRGPLRASAPVPADEGGLTIELPPEEALAEDEEGDGISLDFVPEVQRLEVESIQVDRVKGVTFGQLVEEAKREKALRGQT